MPTRSRKPSRKHTPQPRFPVQTPVLVKPGVTDPDLPEISLDGRSGTIIEIDPPWCLVEWDRRTRQAIGLGSRFDRAGRLSQCMWLHQDHLEENDEAPFEEQPQHSWRQRLGEQNDRIAAVFGLRRGSHLPEANLNRLQQYHRYLQKELKLPFAAIYEEETAEAIRRRPITVTALLPADAENGLRCRAIVNEEEVDLPLARVYAPEDEARRQLLADYAYWFTIASQREVSAVAELPAAASQPAPTPRRKRKRRHLVESSSSDARLPEATWSLGWFFAFGSLVGASLGAACASLDGAVTAILVGAAVLGGVLGLLCLAACLLFRFRADLILPFVLTLSVLGVVVGGAVGVAFLAWRGAVLGVFAAVSAACYRGRFRTSGLVGGLILGTTAECLLVNPRAWSSALAGALVAALLVPPALFGMAWPFSRWLRKSRSPG